MSSLRLKWLCWVRYASRHQSAAGIILKGTSEERGKGMGMEMGILFYLGKTFSQKATLQGTHGAQYKKQNTQRYYIHELVR